EPVGRLLNLCRTQNHPCKPKRTRFCLRAIEHALRNAQTAVAAVEVHSTKLRVVGAVAFDTKRTDNLICALDNPKGVALGLGKDLQKLLQLAVDCHQDVLLE